MAYNNAMYFLAFLPFVLVIYQLAPKKIRWGVLLFFSYAYYLAMSKKLIVYLFASSLITYAIGMWINALKVKCKNEVKQVEKELKKELKQKYKKKQKWVMILGIISLLAILVTIKYYNFFTDNIEGLFGKFGGSISFPTLKLLMPLGISFYTLEAISYMADIYWDKVQAEKNPLKVCLFLGFFPQIMEGPIAAYNDTSKGLFAGESLKEENLLRGSIRIAWGLFKKSIIADRLFVVVTYLFDNYKSYSGAMIIVAAVAYTVQLYMEFSGVIDIVIGSGKLFNVDIPENFRQPFASKSASEFWRRWHISLGVWFRTYIFYPVSMSKLAKNINQFGKQKNKAYVAKVLVSALALFPVWICNGLWHGPEWTYVFYGVYYFVIILLEIVLEPITKKLLHVFKDNDKNPIWIFIQTIKTLIIIFSGELFFNSKDLKSAFEMYGSIFRNFDIENLWNGTMFKLGLDKVDFVVVFVALLIVGVVSHFKEKGVDVHEKIRCSALPIRWFAYIGLIMLIVIFGAYGPGYQEVNLIYAGF